MRSRAAHVKILDRRAKRGVTWCWAQEEKLFERKLALKNISFAQAPLKFEIERCDDLPVQDDVFDIGRVSAMVLTTVSPKASF